MSVPAYTEAPQYEGVAQHKHPGHTVWVPAVAVAARWAPGSTAPPWTWEDERRDVLSRTGCCRSGQCAWPHRHGSQPGVYQRELEAWIEAEGMPDTPLCLGSDGRVWDGNHRMVAALRFGLDVPVLAEEWQA